MRPYFVISLPFVLTCSVFAQQYVISTYAGGAPPPSPVRATDATIGSVLGIAADRTGNVYLASIDFNSIFRLTPEGTLTLFAGNGRPGYGGDGGPAVSATLHLDYGVSFSVPAGVAVDKTGNVLIADVTNARIRRVSPDGIITTVAGNGSLGAAGDGGLATEAQLNVPVAVAVDGAGNVYISDRGNYRIRRVSASGIITTLAGTGAPVGLSGDGGPATSAVVVPDGIAVDSAGNLYFAESHHARIRKVSPDGIISTVAGGGTAERGDGGPAANVRLSCGCWGIAVDDAGNLLVAERLRIRRISSDGIIATVAGDGTAGYSGDGGPATAAQLSSALGVAVDGANNVSILDVASGRVRKVSADGVITTVAGNGKFGHRWYGLVFSGDNGPATGAQVSWPWGVAVDAHSNLFIADSANARVRRVSSKGIITTIAGNGSGGFSGDAGPAVEAEIGTPIGVAVDSGGNLLILDGRNSRVRRVSSGGLITTVAGDGTQGFSGDGGPAVLAQLGTFATCNSYCGGIATDAAGNLFIADPNNHRVRKVSPDGIITTVAGIGVCGFTGDGGPAEAARLCYPAGVACDDRGNLFIAEAGRIRKISVHGTIATIAGGGLVSGSSADGGPATDARLSFPTGVTLDGAGNLFFSDPGWNFLTSDAAHDAADHRIRRVSPDGIITTLAGNGEAGFSGDGGPAVSARLSGPVGLVVDRAGNIYVADATNHVVRVLEPVREAPGTMVPE